MTTKHEMRQWVVLVTDLDGSTTVYGPYRSEAKADEVKDDIYMESEAAADCITLLLQRRTA